MAVKQEVLPPIRPRKGAKPRSPRYYIAMMDAVFDQACRGQRSVVDAQRMTEMLGKRMEAHLQLLLLENAGVNSLIDVAPGPEEGFVPPPVRAHRQKKVTVKRGTGRHGERVDETTVAITSNAEDQDAETDAQIESLA
jgi:hypothetical protein